MNKNKELAKQLVETASRYGFSVSTRASVVEGSK